jgi:hypothetical protein
MGFLIALFFFWSGDMKILFVLLIVGLFSSFCWGAVQNVTQVLNKHTAELAVRF